MLCGAILTALAANEKYQRALELYDALAPLSQSNVVCHAMALRACTALKEYARGKQLHALIGCDVDGNVKLRDALIFFYCACGDQRSAEQLFDCSISQAPYTQLLSLYLSDGRHNKALELTRKGDSGDGRGVVALMRFYGAKGEIE